jgi:hypothetical protein
MTLKLRTRDWRSGSSPRQNGATLSDGRESYDLPQGNATFSA